ncbi:thioredoxin-like protein, partial [Violaceomyces palustris]
KKFGKIINPVFISCDPARDTVEQLARYISDFHPRMVGLTGDYDSVKSACKAYRVYFSTPPSADPMGDYLVDHSIFFYLMDPEGKFVEAFGRSVDAQEVGNKVEGFIQKWKETAGSIQVADARERVAKDGRPKVDKETLKPLDKAP